jgi:hypothetical protein
MTAVNLLESNWISIQEIFELANRVLTRIFIGLWPKQKVDVPADDLKKLAKVFDTPRRSDPADEEPLREARCGGGHCTYLCAW